MNNKPAYAKITLKELKSMIKDLGPHDYKKFAQKLYRRSKVLGIVMHMHANDAIEARIKKLPYHPVDLDKWPAFMKDEALEMAREGIRTEREAREWWLRHY